MVPTEVVIRDPKFNTEDIFIKLAAVALSLAVKAALLVAIIPPTFAMFGIDVTPNFGEALLLVLLVALVLPSKRILTLTSSDKNRYLKENK